MSDAAFEASNQAYLRASMAWLRTLLEEAAPKGEETKSRSWFRCTRATPRNTKSAKAARAEMDKAAAAAPTPAFVFLARRYDLSTFEQDMLLLAAAMEIDSGMPDRLAAVQADATRRYPTFALAMALFGDPRWDAMSPERPLRAHRLLEVHQSGAVSLLNAPLRIDERIAAYIKGLNYLDERLRSIATLLPAMGELPASQEQIAHVLSRWLASQDASGVVQLTGSNGAAKADIAVRAATIAERTAVSVRADALPTGVAEIEDWACLWSRESRLLPLLLFIHDAESATPAGDDSRGPGPARWARALARLEAPCIVDVRRGLAELDVSPVLPAAAPTDAERRVLWNDALTIDDVAPEPEAVSALAGEFQLSVSQLNGLVARARALGSGEAEPAGERVAAAVTHAWDSCVQHTGSSLASLTRWIRPRASMDDIKLPASERAQLERLIEHARHRRIVTSDFGFEDRGGRGLGLTALFHGESGTGKTFAAEAVANELGLGLAVVDYATVSSKWVGETEKNWRRIFDAAERGGTVLFIDEADAKLGKRREGTSSQDHYINAEIDYLLTRMESFNGVAILATNMKHVLDRAFMRRLRFVVAFPFPGVAERKAIWQSVFPAQAPVGALDFDELARFPISGGSIFNAALDAAHFAAAAGGQIAMRQVREAIIGELRKLDRPVSSGVTTSHRAAGGGA